MKKLMFVAAGVAVAGSAFANPLIYDYKASVKGIYLKKVQVKNRAGTKVDVYQKIQKSWSLKGYLIMDEDGVTSPTYGAATTAGCYDQGRNRGFLVVLNNGVEKDVKQPKILPAVLDAKWFDQKLNVSKGVNSSGYAEGTLFAGGESVKCVRPRLDMFTSASVATERGVDLLPNEAEPGAPGMSAYADYVWTSVYLFGQYNGPQWFGYSLGANPFDQFEAAWDTNLPAGVQTARAGGEPVFHDAWLNGAGIGKYVVPGKTVSGQVCCGLDQVTTYYKPILDSLSGNLKGGEYICTENGILADTYNFVGAIEWEDQFVTLGHSDPSWTYITAGDTFQTDLWQDGAVEQETTDVLYGTWSIKRTTKAIAEDLTVAEIASIAADTGSTTVGTRALLSTIKGAAHKLLAASKWPNGGAWYDGSEIHTMTDQTRFSIPMVTPKFIRFYGLVD